MTDQATGTRPDFFVSYTGADRAWAEWIAYRLEAKGYRCVIQAWDFPPGANFVVEMHEAARQPERTIAVLSPTYLRAAFPTPEWAAAIADDPRGSRRKLVPVRVEECQPEGMLRGIVYIDLVGLDEVAAAEALLRGVVPGRAKPATSPTFPGTDGRAASALTPPFPGNQPRREPLVFGGAMPARNGNFTGRAALLEAVQASLATTPDQPMALTQAAVRGLGGVGKTSLAREYVHRFGPDYGGVWWLTAETREGIIAGLAALAAQLDPKLTEAPELEKAARTALARAETSDPPFLLVYDNVPSPGVLEGLVPARGARVLLTTRWADWGGRAREILVEALAEDEAIEFLQVRAGRRDPAGARRLALDLGCLPLALDHAGAYVRRAVIGFDTYAKRVEELIAKAPKDALYPASVAATFDLAIASAVRECAAAERLLDFFAFLAPERIPLGLADQTVLPEDERGEALMALTAVSLVQPDRATADDEVPSVSVHRLVQAVTRTRLAVRDAAGAMLETVVSRLAGAFPVNAYDDMQSWPECERLIPHALALRERVRQRGSASATLADLLDKAASFLHRRGSSLEAEPILREALAIGECTLGRDHPDTAAWMNNLAKLLHSIGRHAEAEPLYREALAVSERALGRDHPEFATRLDNLANLLRDTGRHAEAEPMLREALAVSERALGRDHPEVAIRLNNLANLLCDTGGHAEAEPMYREALAIGERALGRDHPDVALYASNLAVLLRDVGRAAEVPEICDQRRSSPDAPMTSTA